MHQVIGERDLPETSLDAGAAIELYRDLVRTRRFDERALALQRRGWMSGYPPYKGQEASQVGAAHALDREDWIFPTYRSNALQIAFGVPMSDIFLFRRGYTEYDSGHELNVFPQAVPIATQIPHAAGAGMAINYVRRRAGREDDRDDGRGDVAGGGDQDGETDDRDGEAVEANGGATSDEPDDHAVLCYFGDGATSEGDFHEGANFAGVFDAPVVFFCENNDWAISVPRERQTASDTIAQKAIAYGFDGVRVDGNDPIAVYETVSEALETARRGDPVLVESLTYRHGAHTTADDPTRYRDAPEHLPAWRTADPVDRYEFYLREQGVLDDDTVDSIHDAVETELDDAIETAESRPMPSPDEIFDDVFERADSRLTGQQAWLREFLERHDDVQEIDH